MMTEQIVSLIIIGICPNLISIMTAIGLIMRVMREFKALKAQVIDMKSIDALNATMNQVMRENYELKKKLNETLTKIDHIERK